MSEKTIGMLQGFILSIVLIIGGCTIFAAIPFLDAVGGPQSDENVNITRSTIDYPSWTIDEPEYHKQARETAEQDRDCPPRTL